MRKMPPNALTGVKQREPRWERGLFKPPGIALFDISQTGSKRIPDEGLCLGYITWENLTEELLINRALEQGA